MSLLLRATFITRGARLLGTESVKFALRCSNKNVKIPTTSFALSRYLATDKKPNDNPAYLIYEGALSNQIRNIKIFSLATSCFSVFIQSYVFWRHLTEGTGDVAFGVFLSVGAIVILTPVLLHRVTKKYVVRMIHRPKTDTYTAMVYTLLMGTKKIDFQPKDVTVPTITGMFATCKIKNYPIFIDPKSFLEIEHYQKIMGYDKPMDFKLGTPETVTKEEVEVAKTEICAKKDTN